jgi:hypothetical protein
MTIFIWILLGFAGFVSANIFLFFSLFRSTPPVQSTAELNRLLQQQLDFNAEDLVANRNGRLSPAQLQKLQTTYPQQSHLGCGVAVTILPILFFLAALFLGEGRTMMAQLLRQPTTLLIYAALIGLVISVGIGSLLYQHVTLRPYSEQTVQPIQGKVRLRIIAIRGTHYHVSIRRRTFYVTQQQYSGFVSGATYRIYYIPYYTSSYIIVSAEAI